MTITVFLLCVAFLLFLLGNHPKYSHNAIGTGLALCVLVYLIKAGF